jgi:hypothetical protein
MSLTSKRQAENVFSHWYAWTDHNQFSTQEFYTEIEKELVARRVPGLKISQVNFREGGSLSDKRIYLRLVRERLAFDICASPFGRTFFFSMRFVEKPLPNMIPALLFFAIVCAVLATFIHEGGGQYLNLGDFSGGLSNPFIACLTFVVAGFFLVIFSVGVVRTGRTRTTTDAIEASDRAGPAGAKPSESSAMPDFDTLLLNMPFIGDLYLALRKETYYRQDTRLMYHTLISDIVKMKVDEITAAKGVKLVRSYECNPILGDLYKPTPTTPRELAPAVK